MRDLPDTLNAARGLLWPVAILAGLYVAYRAYGSLDAAAKVVLTPVGQLWSDVSAALNGNHRIEQNAAPSIYPHLFDAGWHMMPEAVAAYEAAGHGPLLATILAAGQLKPEYRHLMGVPLTEQALRG